MSIIRADSFGNVADGVYSAGDKRLLGSQWSTNGNLVTIDNIGGGRKWLRNSHWGQLNLDMRTTEFSPLSEVGLSLHLNRPNYHESVFWRFYNASSESARIRGTGVGALQWRDWHGSTGKVHTITPELAINTTHHIELHVVLHDTAGELTVWVNGVKTFEETGIWTGNQAQVTNLWSYVWGIGWKVTDFILHTFPAPIGPMQVFYLPASADGAQTDFTPETGTDNYAMVNEIGPDEDDSYNESDGTPGHRDAFEHDGIATNLEVLAVGALARVRKTDVGASFIKVGIEHGIAEDQSAELSVLEDYHSMVGWFPNVPDGAGWTPAQVNATKFHYEVGGS